MLSRTLFAALVAIVSASPCRPPPSSKPTLPSTGTIDLPAPNPSGTLKAIAVGHGIQNYTCANGVATATAAGALAVLYDVTPFYPGGLNGLSNEGFNSLTTAVLWTQDVPLNLVDPAAAKPGTPDAPNKGMPPSAYGAAAGNPFRAAADITLGEEMPPLKFLGHHYFDAAGAPTFDLSTRNMRFSVGLKESVNQPAESDKGILGTGAVKWLLLNDNGKGQSTLGSNSQVYRVITAGGVAQACSTEGAVPKGSVPYTAFYWFYG
ncbi:hypothetical protein GGTG_06368 [Gaeumannomyces tritici R3-111a-1]|uniref:Malate dehydrogenase n=1 Tax=Gaeumannomyces tritici (strain R3-111a-1) TaxID=644352 RepID=J3NYL6_GAET3|nr:hypothetical protein GGTG_06368 [Gaeumannomyces tritici R3-111a-1]EJT76449.1 hypothetical protein GGTG_06368 [Gaeumannomyces tritici R3-111a-1]